MGKQVEPLEELPGIKRFLALIRFISVYMFRIVLHSSLRTQASEIPQSQSAAQEQCALTTFSHHIHVTLKKVNAGGCAATPVLSVDVLSDLRPANVCRRPCCNPAGAAVLQRGGDASDALRCARIGAHTAPNPNFLNCRSHIGGRLAVRRNM